MTDRSAARAVPAGPDPRAVPSRQVRRGTATGRAARTGATRTEAAGASRTRPGRTPAGAGSSLPTPRATPAAPRPRAAAAGGAATGGTPSRAAATGATAVSAGTSHAGTAPRTRRRGSPDVRRRAPFVLFVVALLVGTTLGLLVLNTAIAVDSLKATRLQAENAERAQDVQRLEQQVVTGAAPAQIADAARAAGLVPAATAAYLVIAPDGSVVLRGTPEPAPAPAPPVPFAPAVPLLPATSSAGDGG